MWLFRSCELGTATFSFLNVRTWVSSIRTAVTKPMTSPTWMTSPVLKARR